MAQQHSQTQRVQTTTVDINNLCTHRSVFLLSLKYVKKAINLGSEQWAVQVEGGPRVRGLGGRGAVRVEPSMSRFFLISIFQFVQIF